ncbi:unnamed protein product [Pleuronectes platessa]|uniref:Uncharacterized protein n=1 Tax=Pleuronectes platessa TaxID=8262 RepID=A0A9N7W216_PLEPL|nr:unnamed protein product [Pleuronectes platessa]
MDKYRPKRPTTLALFPQLPQAGTQDTINNNSFGKKDSWKESHSSSPHITGDLAPPDVKPKAEDKVRLNTRRPAPKPPTANEAKSRTNTQAAANASSDARTRLRDKQGTGATHTQASITTRSQRRGAATAAGGGRGGGRGGGGGGGRGAAAMRDRSLGDVKGKDGVTAGREERRTGRLCAEAKAKEKERNVHQRPRETNGLKSRGAEGKGRAGSKVGNRGGGGLKPNNLLSNQEVYLPAMVVPRTPVAPRTQDKTQDKTQVKTQVKTRDKTQDKTQVKTREKTQDKTQDNTQEQGQSHDGTQDNPRAMSRSSSEGGSNRMSLSSDTEGPPPGPPPGPLHPSLSHRTNSDIREEDGEGDLTPFRNVQNRPSLFPAGDEITEMDCTMSEVDAGGGRGNRHSAVTQGDAVAARTLTKSGTAAALNYDSVKYTLVVDEHARLELVRLQDCLHGNNEHNDDSDTETVYQSANEDEDTDYEEERKRSEEARNQERRKEEEEAKKKRWEEDVKRRREEEVKRRKDVVTKIGRQSKVTSTTASGEEEPLGGRGGAPSSRKFLNLFANNSHYSALAPGVLVSSPVFWTEWSDRRATAPSTG